MANLYRQTSVHTGISVTSGVLFVPWQIVFMLMIDAGWMNFSQMKLLNGYHALHTDLGWLRM